MYAPAVGTPAAVAAPAGNPRFPLFDGLRALAVFAVVLFHTNEIAGSQSGWRGAILDQPFGVTIFFVISGFLLYRPFVAARLGKAPGLGTRDYAKRRVLRILPAYWLALTALAIYPGLSGLFGPKSWVYYAFGQDYSADTLLNGDAPAWSLGTEVVFYALLPLYALILALPRLRRSPRTVIVAEAVVLGSLAALAVVFGHSFGPADSFLSRTIVGTFDWFAIGMGLAVASVVLAESTTRHRLVSLVERRPTLLWLAAAATWAVCAAWTRTHPQGARDIYASRLVNVLFALMALFIVLPAVFGDNRSGVPRRILSARVVAWAGLVSYGIFLWHFPIIVKLSQIGGSLGVESWTPGATLALGFAGTAIAVCCAALSYYVLERPVLRLKRLKDRPDLERPPRAPGPEPRAR